MDLDQIIRDLRSDDRTTRLYALKGLGDLGTEAEPALPAVQAFIRNERDQDVRWKATAALGVLALSSDKAIPFLIGVFRDRSRMVFSTVLLALVKIGGRAVPFLVKALDDPHYFIRSGAAGVLARIQDPAVARCVPRLVQALADPEASVRASAALALGAIKPATLMAVQGLLGVLEDPEWRVRDFAVTALGKTGPLTGEVIPALARKLQNTGEEDMIRYDAIAAFEEMGPAAVQALPMLATVLCDEDFIIRSSVVGLIGTFGDAAHGVIPLVEGLCQDPVAEVREAARQALAALTRGRTA
ncbi:MAG: HEAT repeat domain-containing protein [Planctomycetota bacterium]